MGSTAALYLGWWHSLDEQAVRIPLAKRKTALDLLNRFELAKVNLVTLKPKVRFSFELKELQHFVGVFQDFARVITCLKPSMTAFIRLLDGLETPGRLRFLKPRKSKWIAAGLKKFREVVSRNAWVPYTSILRVREVHSKTLRIFTDAAGLSEVGANYGIGSISYDLRLAWQCHHSVFSPFLLQLKDTQPDPRGICTLECLGQAMALFFAGHFRSGHLNDTLISLIGDNEPVQLAYAKGYGRHAAISLLIERTESLAAHLRSSVRYPWISTDVMKSLGADFLSRNAYKRFRELPVIKVDVQLFKCFTDYVYSTLTGARLYIDKLKQKLSVPEITAKRPDVTIAAVNFCLLSQNLSTVRAKQRAAHDILILDQMFGVKTSHFISDRQVEREDAILANYAAVMAVDYLLAPGTIAGKLQRRGALDDGCVIPWGKLRFTKMVIRGIEVAQQKEEFHGVSLGKDLLLVFNSVLDPEGCFFDKLKIFFDRTCTTMICRVGELAPRLSEVDAIPYVLTMDAFKIDDEWFREVAPCNRHAWLLFHLARVKAQKTGYWGLMLRKTKVSTGEVRQFFARCTPGLANYKILQLGLELLIDRMVKGDSLELQEPFFAFLTILNDDGLTVNALTYDDISRADKAQTRCFPGLADVEMRTHLRRSGGANDLWDAKIKQLMIMAVGHWVFGSLAHYARISWQRVVEAQNAGIRRALFRLKHGVASTTFRPNEVGRYFEGCIHAGC